jgi:hypothetical protein
MTELPAALGGTAIHRTTALSRAAPATAQESAPAKVTLQKLHVGPGGSNVSTETPRLEM